MTVEASQMHLKKNNKCFVFPVVFKALSSPLSVSSACPQGTFKSFQGAGLCQQCPLNSRSTIEAATLCSCRNGYYRGDMDRPEDMCTSESHWHWNDCPHTYTQRRTWVWLHSPSRWLRHICTFLYITNTSAGWCHQKSNISSLSYRPISALIYYSDPNFMLCIRIKRAATIQSSFWGLGSSK